MKGVRFVLVLLALMVSSQAFAQTPQDRAEYRALRYLLAEAAPRKVEGGDSHGTPYLTIAAGERIADPGAIIPHGVTLAEPPGFDSVNVTVYGPAADPWEKVVSADRLGSARQGAAPGGSTLFVRYTPFVPEPEHRTPYSDSGNPAHILWYWSYREHRIILARTFGGEISEADANTAIAPLAELVHRGFVEDGLADGQGETTSSGPARYRAIIRIPPLTPGTVLSPSVDVVDDQGQPPKGSIYVSWFINGVNAPSVVWDGSETRVEVQVSVENQALAEAVLIPAATPGGAPVSAVPVSPAPTDPDAQQPEGPLPGMSAAGPLPGPGSLGQALVGTLLPPLLIAIGQLLAGSSGARTPPVTPLPLRPPATTRPTRQPPTPDPNAPWKQRLDRLEQIARHDRNGALAAAVQSIRGQLGAGARDPQSWAAAQQQLKDALGTLDQHLPKPNGAAWDAAAAVVGGTRDAAVQVGGAIGDVGGGLLAFPGQVWQGVKGLGNGLLHPGHFVTGVSNLAKDWISKNLKTEGQAFTQGLKDGKVGDALTAMGQGLVKAAGSALSAAWDKVGKAVLPVDELKSFTDPHASLEEKLWAVPAAAVKIAGILIGLHKPTPQPSTVWGKAVQQGLKQPVPPPQTAVVAQPKPKLPGPARPRPAVPPAAPASSPPPAAPAAPAGVPVKAPAAPAAAPAKKRLFQGAADGSEIEIVPPSEITPSNHSSVVGDISLESINRAEHYRFFKVDRSGVRMMEAGAGVEDLCDVMLPKNKRPWEITDTDIIVCTSDKAKAARIRAQVKRHLEQIGGG